MIEGEKTRIIAENVPDATAEKEASLGEIEFRLAFVKPCKAAVVAARYAWQVSYLPIGDNRRVTKPVPKQRTFTCGKFLGAWVCR
jgi:hypothetical protein